MDVLLQRFYARQLPPLHEIPGNVNDKTIILTGPTSGIGKATAKELAKRGANLILACRNIKKGESLKKELQQKGCNGEKITVMQLDTSNLKSVRAFVNEWAQFQSGKAVDVLINNAGIFDVGVGRKITEDGFEMHMITNHLGHLLLTLLMMQYLVKSGEGRVVSVSSLMYLFSKISVGDPQLVNGYNSRTAYSNSKMAQMLVTKTLHQKFYRYGVHFFAVHPGEVYTNVTQNWPWLIHIAYKLTNQYILFLPEQGARPSFMCAANPDMLKWSSELIGQNCEKMEKMLPGWFPDNGWGEDWKMLEEWMWHWSLESIQVQEQTIHQSIQQQ